MRIPKETIRDARALADDPETMGYAMAAVDEIVQKLESVALRHGAPQRQFVRLAIERYLGKYDEIFLSRKRPDNMIPKDRGAGRAGEGATGTDAAELENGKDGPAQ